MKLVESRGELPYCFKTRTMISLMPLSRLLSPPIYGEIIRARFISYAESPLLGQHDNSPFIYYTIINSYCIDYLELCTF